MVSPLSYLPVSPRLTSPSCVTFKLYDNRSYFKNVEIYPKEATQATSVSFSVLDISLWSFYIVELGYFFALRGLRPTTIPMRSKTSIQRSRTIALDDQTSPNAKPLAMNPLRTTSQLCFLPEPPYSVIRTFPASLDIPDRFIFIFSVLYQVLLKTIRGFGVTTASPLSTRQPFN